MPPTEDHKADIYHIQVRGHLDQRWAHWFEGFSLEYLAEDTLLCGPAVDQAALHGLLAKIRDLGLVIVSLTQYEDTSQGDQVNPE